MTCHEHEWVRISAQDMIDTTLVEVFRMKNAVHEWWDLESQAGTLPPPGSENAEPWLQVLRANVFPDRADLTDFDRAVVERLGSEIERMFFAIYMIVTRRQASERIWAILSRQLHRDAPEVRSWWPASP